MSVSWNPCSLSDIPDKGYPRDETRRIGRTRAYHSRPWTHALESFLALECETASAVYDYDEITPDAIQSSLNSAIRLGGDRFGRLRTLRRGDDIYVTRAPREKRLEYDEIRGLLYSVGEGESLTVDMSEYDERQTRRVYRAMHNMRSREEIGVSVSLSRDEQTLTIRSRV